MTTFHTADDVSTLLIHLGYLMYDEAMGVVAIPNTEILGEFVTATKRGEQWDIVQNFDRKSKKGVDICSGFL